MNSINPIFYFTIKTIFLLGLINLNSIAHSQFINNQKGQIINEFDLFNSEKIKERKINTISVTYSLKKPLQGIYTIEGKTNHYWMDTAGRISRYHFTKNYYNSKIDTIVEWRLYKNNRLSTIKKSIGEKIKVQSYFYEFEIPTIIVHGVSNNDSKVVTNLKSSNYKEDYAEYISYKKLKNGDSIVKWMYTDRTVFKKKTISKIDSNSFQEKFIYPFLSQQYDNYTYEYEKGLLTKLTHDNPKFQNFYYTFTYNTNKELVSFIKYTTKWNSEIEVSELLYDENTGNLQAILTKNRIDNSIRIKKFKYTYYK